MWFCLFSALFKLFCPIKDWRDTMAKPIRATPELRGSEAAEFVKKMEIRQESKIPKKTLELAESIQNFSLSR